MPLKNLEHDGGEDFNEIKNRQEMAFREFTDTLDQETSEEEKERLQREWMNPNNEALWNTIY